MKPTPHQKKVLDKLRNGERLRAPLTLANSIGSRRNTVIGLGIHRFPDRTAVKLETICALREKRLAYVKQVIVDTNYGQAGYSEVILPEDNEFV